MGRYIIPILLFVFAVLFFLQNGSGSGTGSYPPPIKGDWFIDQETEVYDDNIILTGNLTINAKATFVGVSLILNLTYNGEYRIELKNGSLYLYNTFISSSNSSYGYTFNVRKETTLGLFGGEIHNGGYDIYSPGLEIETDNATLYNTLFSENYIGIQCKNSKPKILGNRIINNTYGIILYNSSATIAENNFTENFFGVYANKSSPNVYNNQFYKEKHRGIWSAYSTFTVFNISMLNIYQIGIYLDNSNLTFINSTIESERYAFWFDMNSKVKCINVTFQKFNIYFKDFISLIELFWYIDVFVCWYDGLPIKNANVTFYALDGNIEKNGYTDENGWLRNVVLMEQNQSLLKKVYNTPHNITAEKDKKVGKGNITVDRNKIFSIWIDNVPPHIEVIYPKDKAIMNRTIIIINGHAWDNETGLEKIEVSFEGLSWEKANGTSTWSYPATLSEGKYKIYIRALDIAGNENTTILNITVDITPPYLYIIEPTGDVYTNISYLKIIGVTEPNATVNISLKELYLEVSIDEYGSFEVIANLFEGMNKIIVIAMDRANNTKALEINAILDTTLYPFEIYPANGTYTNERNITISG
ncbi:MAG: Ig-like domain-containing protein, partial [Candidatus Thermoplasmatota archaeon]